MFLTPPNFIFSAQLVPIFEWEPVKPSDGASPTVSAASPCEGAGAAAPDTPTDWRLVFKGYEWQAVGERSIYPREDWESVLRPEADAQDEERDPIAHRSEPAHRHAAPPSHTVSNDIHGTDAAQDKTDSSEPT